MRLAVGVHCPAKEAAGGLSTAKLSMFFNLGEVLGVMVVVGEGFSLFLAAVGDPEPIRLMLSQESSVPVSLVGESVESIAFMISF